MKKIIICILIVFFYSNIVFSKWNGGANDGHSTDRFVGTLNGKALVHLFQGGEDEGFSRGGRASTLQGIDRSAFYKGGDNDGHSVSRFYGSLSGSSLIALYQGGIEDGFDRTQGHGRINAAALPIDLLSFQAIPLDREVQLKWVTLSEQDNAFFVIERSRDGQRFESLFNVPGAGNSSSEKYYHRFDKEPFLGWSYYRLASHDLDGTIHLSDIEAVYFETKQGWELQIISNPGAGEIIQFLLNTPETVRQLEMEVTDVLGQRLLRWTIEKELDTYQGDFHLPPLITKGIYFLNARAKEGQIGSWLLIQ